MATQVVRIDEEPKVYRKMKKETTYEYIPILGEILGWWRKKSDHTAMESVEIHLVHPLGTFDKLFINGKEIPIPDDAKILKL